MTDSQTRAVLDRAREALTALEHVIGYAAGLEAERDKLIRWHREDNTQMTGAYREAAQFLAERNQALARVAELEEAAVEARAALGSLCYDLEDPGTAALGALHLLTQATVWTETGPDFAAEALAQRDAKVLGEAQARIAELEERDALLSALEAAGVNNWEGYDTAREIAGEAS